MKDIVLYPDPVLREKALEVDSLDGQTVSEIKETIETLRNFGNGAGLAAPQVGISKRFFVTKELKTKKPIVVINPRIIRTFGVKTFPMMEVSGGNWENFLEGCLSFPAIWGTAKRFLKIEVEWQGMPDLKKKRTILEGFEAIVFQHELDHLDGVLFIDRIRDSGGKIYRQEKEGMEEISIGDFV